MPSLVFSLPISLAACGCMAAAGASDLPEIVKLTASDSAEDNRFGEPVAIHGDILLVSSPGRTPGGIYVFDSLTGTELGTISVTDEQSENWNGGNIAVTSTLALVADKDADHNGIMNCGAIYVIDIATGKQLRKLTTSDAYTDDHIGNALAISGNVVVAGAQSESHSDLSSPGSAYAFDLETGEELFKITPDASWHFDSFGASVAISSDYILVGAPRADPNNLAQAGRAFVFERETGEQLSTLVASEPGEDDRFGSTVAIAGSIAIVSAPRDDHSGYANAGSVYLFDLKTGRQEARLTAAIPMDQGSFGHHLVASEQFIVIGSINGGLGVTDVYELDSRIHITRLIASDRGGEEPFLGRPAIDGSRIVVGISNDDPNGVINAGSAYIFDLDELACPADLTDDGVLDLGDVGAFIGAFILQTPIADLNEDGIYDLADITVFVNSFNAGCP